MSRQIYVDASAILALASPASPHHTRAVELLTHLEGPLVTSNLVILRCASSVAGAGGHRKAGELVERLCSEGGLQVLHVDAEVERKGWELFRRGGRRAPDPFDAMSFALMRELGIRMAFTFEKAFRDAGFITIPMMGAGS